MRDDCIYRYWNSDEIRSYLFILVDTYSVILCPSRALTNEATRIPKLTVASFMVICYLQDFCNASEFQVSMNNSVVSLYTQKPIKFETISPSQKQNINSGVKTAVSHCELSSGLRWRLYHPGWGGGYSLRQARQECVALKGMVFEPFWLEIGYWFRTLLSKIGYSLCTLVKNWIWFLLGEVNFESIFKHFILLLLRTGVSLLNVENLSSSQMFTQT